jgi:hypothetical protein
MQAPVAGSQESSVHGLVSAQLTGLPHLPPTQRFPVVQGFWSSQDEKGGRFVCWH